MDYSETFAEIERQLHIMTSEREAEVALYDAEMAGYDAGMNGKNEQNCHSSFFENEWTRSKWMKGFMEATEKSFNEKK